MRDSAVIYSSNLIQVNKLKQTDPVMAGELAIATMEMALTGEITSNNPMIEIMLEQYKVLADKNADRFNKTVESKKRAVIENQRLEEIAELMKQGRKQVEIAKMLELSTSTINDRVKKIRRDYPELLSGGIEKSGEEIPDFSEKAENPVISKNPEETGFELDNKNPGDSKNPENSAGSEKQADILSEKSGNEADFIEKTGFIF